MHGEVAPQKRQRQNRKFVLAQIETVTEPQDLPGARALSRVKLAYPWREVTASERASREDANGVVMSFLDERFALAVQQVAVYLQGIECARLDAGIQNLVRRRGAREMNSALFLRFTHGLQGFSLVRDRTRVRAEVDLENVDLFCAQQTQACANRIYDCFVRKVVV